MTVATERAYLRRSELSQRATISSHDNGIMASRISEAPIAIIAPEYIGIACRLTTKRTPRDKRKRPTARQTAPIATSPSLYLMPETDRLTALGLCPPTWNGMIS